MFCPSCGTEYEEGKLNCDGCSKELPQTLENLAENFAKSEDIENQITLDVSTDNKCIPSENKTNNTEEELCDVIETNKDNLTWEEIEKGIFFNAVIVGASEYFLENEELNIGFYPDKISFNKKIILLKDKIFDIKPFLKLKNNNNLTFLDKNIYLRTLAGGAIGLVLSGMVGASFEDGIASGLVALMVSFVAVPLWMIVGALSSISVKTIYKNKPQSLYYLCIKYFDKEDVLKTILLDMTESQNITKKLKIYLKQFPLKLQDKNIEL